MNKLNNAPILKTKLHHYRYDLSIEAERADYKRLCDNLKSKGYVLMDAISGNTDKTVSGEISLDCACLFNNQWNTTKYSENNPNMRVFDWHESIVFDRDLKIGHWLEITAEMDAIRENTHQCGFCGSYEPSQKGHIFCPHCLDSAYLKEDELRLLRMRPVSQKWENQLPLSNAEKEHLMPLYLEAQTKTIKAANAKKRQAIINKCDEKTQQAITERDGMLWLIDHGINTDNCIYYKHTNSFSFGWKSKLSESVANTLTETLTSFDFDYDIKREDAA